MLSRKSVLYETDFIFSRARFRNPKWRVDSQIKPESPPFKTFEAKTKWKNWGHLVVWVEAAKTTTTWRLGINYSWAKNTGDVGKHWISVSSPCLLLLSMHTFKLHLLQVGSLPSEPKGIVTESDRVGKKAPAVACGVGAGAGAWVLQNSSSA